MTSTLLQKTGLKVFEQHMRQYEPADPVYETYTDKKGKQRRRRRELPPGLSARDQKILKRVQKHAHRLDKGFGVGGIRFGWTAIIGLIPMAGDVTDALLNYMLVVRNAKEAEIPDWLLRRMLVNNAVSAGLGFVPLVGDVFIAIYKANSRNAALLEEFLRIRGAEFLKVDRNKVEDRENVKPGAGAVKGEILDSKKNRWWR